ncbi:MAG: HAD family hydrolase [Candidatus Delongbacteria bacterium]|nr:HAD family hydrolase [Candidatus Delongbacteria bacterium]MCG2759724.1 HAD family hydrolase [Candidatus Delongbacteria bacterium]
MKNKAVFLDRDGTVNIDKDYLYKIDDFQFESGVTDTLKYLFDRGYKLIIISNQSGIARGYFSVDDVEILHKHIKKAALESGFEIAEIYYCPHFADGNVKKFAIECKCRKPGTELIERAINEHNIDRSQSYMIGDKESDIIAGKNAGLKTILVGTGYGKETAVIFKDYDYYFENISGIKAII